MSRTLIAGIVCLGLGAAGCTDLKPIQAQLDDLKASVGRLQTGEAGIKSALDGATRTAQAAQASAKQAQATADSAATAAQASQQCCTATNEKIDRMFKNRLVK